jgi:hypothetical protein
MRRLLPLMAAFSGLLTATQVMASTAAAPLVGPLNLTFPKGGDEAVKAVRSPVTTLPSWSISGWVRPNGSISERQTILRIGDAAAPQIELSIGPRAIIVRSAGDTREIRVPVNSGEWHSLVLSSDNGKGALYWNGKQANVFSLGELTAFERVTVAPRVGTASPFGGEVALITVSPTASDAATVAVFQNVRPSSDLGRYETGSPRWPLQIKQQMGLVQPQEPSLLPIASTGVAAEPADKAFEPDPKIIGTHAAAPNSVQKWRLIAAESAGASGKDISTAGYADDKWMPAIVPGTVLTSMIAAGVYPHPAYGLNNLRIPESLADKAYWYRAQFNVSDADPKRRIGLVLNGVNYAAEVWLNGSRVGDVGGAFIRGRFDISSLARRGAANVLAIKVLPPPNPGIAHEESLAGGPGQNGGRHTVDGPSFVASEGWDWIPGVRDRNTGLWQDVVIEETGPVRIGDLNVTTILPKPDNSIAELTIDVPLHNNSGAPAKVDLQIAFGDVKITQLIDVPAGTTVARLSSDKHPALRIANPKLWWPNGYGDPHLHGLDVTASIAGDTSDKRSIKFGMREVSYELSTMAASGALERNLYRPALTPGQHLVDVSHAGIRKVAGGWSVSRTSSAPSTALSPLPPSPLTPNIVIRVNGTPIAVRGGNWGMDDWLKRVERGRLEPYFRLHRDANVNTIRNWVGQSTQESFFALADEYGLLVLNDFWISTQDHNGEPGDTKLFLDNAEDTIRRFRHHPSIVLWLGRNEGVPPPVLNEGLEKLVRTLDGTRYYTGNSRSVNMADSGPWDYQAPDRYFTDLAQGFSTEVGTPSFPTIEAFRAMMPAADTWPISDSWAYHDWHQAAGGNVKSFMDAMIKRLGAPRDLEDFERKAQLLNFETHRAIFEGMNAGLFTKNSGRLLWMTQPAWPSTHWQMLSHDYDTHASFFGVKKGSEPVHVQMNLSSDEIMVVNSLPAPIDGAVVEYVRVDLKGKEIARETLRVKAAGLATTIAASLPKPSAAFPVEVVKLQLRDNNKVLSDNFYWRSARPEDQVALAPMDTASVAITSKLLTQRQPDESAIEIVLSNNTAVPALMAKLTLVGNDGKRILPAYWSENYVSLLPGESRTVTVSWPTRAAKPAKLKLRGWNVTPREIDLN